MSKPFEATNVKQDFAIVEVEFRTHNIFTTKFTIKSPLALVNSTIDLENYVKIPKSKSFGEPRILTVDEHTKLWQTYTQHSKNVLTIAEFDEAGETKQADCSVKL